MPKLLALAYIQVGLREYAPGALLPPDNPDAAAWVESGAAVWKPDDYQPQSWPRAKLATAEPGRTGLAVGGEVTGDDLVGKVPKTYQRRRDPCRP